MNALERMIRRRLSKHRGGVIAVYELRDPGGNVKYIGSTNNLKWRFREHYESGKVRMGDVMAPIGQFKTRQSAEAAEEQAIKRYREAHGGNLPPYNRTPDGLYHGKSR